MTINDNATTSISNRRTLRCTLSKPLHPDRRGRPGGGLHLQQFNRTGLRNLGVRRHRGVVENPESAPQITADLAGITKQNVAKIAPTRLADGLVPPTNRWFSGLVFGDQPQPVFPMPLSAALTDTGLRHRPAEGHRVREDDHGRQQPADPGPARRRPRCRSPRTTRCRSPRPTATRPVPRSVR